MRLFISSIFTISLTFLIFGNLSFANEKMVTLTLPPASLEQWYKPANKRHVWLHVMFKLRREMQAVSEYAAAGDQEHLLKWTQKLVKDYKKAGEMVPEWKQRMKPELVDTLLNAVQKSDKDLIKRTQRKLGSICRKCHDKYRAITAAIYRSADFSNIKVNDIHSKEPLAYMDTMDNLSKTMNRIVISIVDQKFDIAESSRKELSNRLNNLAQSCSECHKDNSARETILGTENTMRFKELAKLLESNNIQKAGRAIGEIAVTACARCHSIHRTASDLRDVFE